MPHVSSKVIWCGDPPEECDLCHAEIKELFYDAKVKSAGSWAIMCFNCWRSHNGKVGTGIGQKYRKNNKGEFEKVEG